MTIKYPQFFEANKRAVAAVIKEVKWQDDGGEGGWVSQKTGKETTKPHGRSVCEGPHSSGTYNDQDLKIFVDCHPSEIGVYCHHTTCVRSIDYASRIRANACIQQKVPHLRMVKVKENPTDAERRKLEKKLEKLVQNGEDFKLQICRSDEREENVKLARIGLQLRNQILAEAPKNSLEILKKSSPKDCSLLTPLRSLLLFLDQWPADSIIWIGNTGDSGGKTEKTQKENAKRFVTREEWQERIASKYKTHGVEWPDEFDPRKSLPILFGCFTTGSTFKKDSFSRALQNVEERIWFPFECDGGLSADDQAALLLHLRDVEGFELGQVVDSGGKSLHGHIRIGGNKLSEETLLKISALLCGCNMTDLPKAQRAGLTDKKCWGGLGADDKMLTKCQPCRVPGVPRYDSKPKEPWILQRHKNRKMQTLLYLNPELAAK
jgi:hypothetical protein